MSRNIKLEVAYIGTAYSGFQSQPGGNTVQDKLEGFLSRVCNEPVTVYGSGRTDAGVHALGQVVNFRTESSIPCRNIVSAARSLLPGDIYVRGAAEVPAEFHARFSAKSKTYEYRLHFGEYSPFLADRAWQLEREPDFALMQQTVSRLPGTRDFSCFRSSGSGEDSGVRTVYTAELMPVGTEGDWVFRICGNGFLYHMVRNIVGALLEIGWGQRPAEQLFSGVKSPAPAGGLYLMRVEY